MDAPVREVMTKTVVAVREETPFKEIARLLHEYRIGAVPVLDADDRVIGIVSDGDLLLKEDAGFQEERFLESRRRRAERGKARGLVARSLMTAPAITVEPTVSHREAARLMHRAHVKRLPVVDERGRVLGIVSRSDLIGMFLRDDAEIGREICDDVIGRALWLDPAGFVVRVTDGVVTIEGEVERRSLMPVLSDCIRRVDGVVGVQLRLTWAEDYLQRPESPIVWSGLGLRR